MTSYVVIYSLASEVKDGARNNLFPQKVSDFVISCQQLLSVFILLARKSRDIITCDDVIPPLLRLRSPLED